MITTSKRVSTWRQWTTVRMVEIDTLSDALPEWDRKQIRAAQWKRQRKNHARLTHAMRGGMENYWA